MANQQIEQKIEEIYQLVISHLKSGNKENSIGLFGGNVGLALFLYEYSQYKPEKQDENYTLISSIIDDAFEEIGNGENLLRTYCNGIIGTLWTVEFMRKHQVLDMDDDYVDDEIVSYLQKGSLIDTLHANNCDLLHGGFGWWMYLLQNNKIKDYDKIIADQFLALEKITIDRGNGLCDWKINPQYMDKKEGGSNFGLAHGICSIIILLSKFKLAGMQHPAIDTGIKNGLAYIESYRKDGATLNGLYPFTIVDGKPSPGSRVAWCYGDFCIALANWHAYKATLNEQYKSKSIEIMDYTAERKELSNARVVDAGLCHGSFGNAQLFRRFYWETGIEKYNDTANYWIEIGLKQATFTDGLAGYKAFRSEEYGGWAAEIGLLEGVAGMGLSLISATTNKPSDWDSFLLIS